MTRKRRVEPKHIIYGPICDVKGYENVRWVEHVSDGLRFVGYADEICKLRHTGWFTHDDGDPDETLRGVVYRLPARNGLSMYVYGHADPNNDDCAFLVMGTPALEKEDAARWADNFAEHIAERERDFHRAWDAGRRYDDLGEQIKSLRTEAMELLADMRAARGKFLDGDAALYRAGKDRVRDLLREMKDARKERADLLSTFGRESGWEE